MQRLGSRVEQPFLCKLKLLVSLPLVIELGSSIQVILSELEHAVEERMANVRAMELPYSTRVLTGRPPVQGRAGVAGVPSSGHASKGIPRNPTEFPISSHTREATLYIGRYVTPKETSGAQKGGRAVLCVNSGLRS
jgi:hypothetical protein